MKKRQMYIHVGPHKTGTTTIQKGLMANSQRLLDMGYEYPKIGLWMLGQHKIAADIGENPNFTPQGDGIKALLDHIEKTTHNIILSSEAFDAIESAAQWSKFRDLFSDHFDFHIIGYLRPQEDLIISLWKTEYTMVRNRHLSPEARKALKDARIDSFPGWTDAVMKSRAFLNYENWLDLLADVFGKETLRFQIYQPGAQNLFFDFLSQCDITDRSNFTLEPDQSISLPHLAFEIMRLLYWDPFNRQSSEISIEESRAFNQSRIKGSGIIHDYLKEKNIDLDTSQYTAEQLSKMRAYYKEPNQNTARKYFNQDYLFQTPSRITACDKNILENVNRHHMMAITARLLRMERHLAAQNT